jgi:membrane protease YdiL (CAAX protease family)
MFPFASRINAAGWVHLVFFGLLIPFFVFRNRKKAVPKDQPLPARLPLFQKTAVELTGLAFVSLMVARVQWISLFPRAFPPPAAIAAGLAVLAAQIAYMRPRWRRAVQKKSRIVHLFMPSNARERGWWLAVAVLAGIGEEITWRGVQWALLANLTRNYLAAAILCSIMFGAAHLLQGWRSALGIVAFALGFHLLVWLAGSLYVAMAVHVAYDVIAGLSYGRLGRELGYGTPEANPL